jgi:DNA polymerase
MSDQYDLFGDAATPILAAGRYGEFAGLLRDSECTRCSLSEGRSRIVVDRGNPEARIMAVGEGPGEQEDAQGLAFVGRAGKLMDRLFTDAGMDTGRHLLIANVVKCRPPGNRAPKKEEAETCLPFLERQISLVRPHTILLLGATAVRHLFREKKAFTMKNEAGRIFSSPRYPETDLMILFHPAYLLRDPRKQPLFLEHLGVLREHLEPLGRWPGK